jgi:hypothetical protein
VAEVVSERESLLPLAPTVLRFQVGVGALIRGRVRSEIEGEAWARGLEVETRETKGLLDSIYRFKVSGESDAVVRFQRDITRWLEEIES